MGAELLHRKLRPGDANADQRFHQSAVAAFGSVKAGLGSPSVDGSTPTGHLALPQSLGGVAPLLRQAANAS